jgi:hypothetical protein
MATMPSAGPFDVQVTPIETPDGRWVVRIALSDASGNVVTNTEVTAVLFSTPAEADRAGWTIADGWLQRLRELRPGN